MCTTHTLTLTHTTTHTHFALLTASGRGLHGIERGRREDRLLEFPSLLALLLGKINIFIIQ